MKNSYLLLTVFLTNVVNGLAFLQAEKIEVEEATERVVAAVNRRDPTLVAVNMVE